MPKEQKSDAIYSIPCNDCNQEYIGQTKRQFVTRLKEHQKVVSLSKRDNSALSEHTCQANHTIAWGNSKIITTNRRYHQRRCLEAWHINSAHAPLNRDDGGLLPDAYLHLINRWCHHSKSSIKVTRYSAKITPGEDTRPECRNVGSWIVTSLSYVHKKFLQTRVAFTLCLILHLVTVNLYLTVRWIS